MAIKKCKDCKYFKNDCDFSEAENSGNFVACGQFVPSMLIRNCFSCSNSFSEFHKDGDILHCMEQDGKVVAENEYCDDWN